MDHTDREHLIAALSESSTLVHKNDSFGLRKVSNRLIDEAAIVQDTAFTMTAVLIYSLSKVVHRGIVSAGMPKQLTEATAYLKKQDYGGFNGKIRNMMRLIASADKKTKLYVSDVIEQAQVKRGCQLCSLGISTARAAEILGVSQFELMRYLGQTQVAEDSSTRVSVTDRLALARRLFG